MDEHYSRLTRANSDDCVYLDWSSADGLLGSILNTVKYFSQTQIYPSGHVWGRIMCNLLGVVYIALHPHDPTCSSVGCICATDDSNIPVIILSD